MFAERRSASRRLTCAIALLLSLLLFGCQTGRSLGGGCPGVYSGLRYYNAQISTIPWDGKIFFFFDLPFSAISDTLLLPYTSFADRKKPPEGWVVGCSWADR